MTQRRVLIVFDGECWFVRRVIVIEEDGYNGQRVYRCDKPLGGDYKTLKEASDRANHFLRTGR